MSPLIYDAIVALCEELGYTVQDSENVGTFVLKDGIKVREEPLSDEDFQVFALQLERLSKDCLLKMFHFYWLDGRLTTALGKSVCDAATEAGIGAGAMPAMDFYSEGLSPIAKFMPETKHWVHKSIALSR